MRICVLGSGSGGNCTLVETKDFSILIDAARLSQKYIRERLDLVYKKDYSFELSSENGFKVEIVVPIAAV